MVILPYKDRLLLFSRYLQQLIMESLGKQFDLHTAQLLAHLSPAQVMENASQVLSRLTHNVGFVLAPEISRAGRFTQSWYPDIRPASCSGISEWMIPRPAVIHCTPPPVMTPALPWLSRWRMRPA